MASFTWLFLKKLRYNFAEHIVLNCFLVTGGFIYSLLVALMGMLSQVDMIVFAGYFVVLGYYLFGLYRSTEHGYTIAGFAWRVLCVILLYSLVFVVGLLLFINLFFGPEFEGTIGFERL
jgi:hypothetical protein